MVIGEKLKTLRAQKNMSQGDLEKRTGLSVATFHALRTDTPSPPLTL